LVETVALETDAFWNFVYTFDSLHAGYGDRSGEIVAEVITPHEVVITVEGGEIVSAVMDEAWDMIDQAEIDG
jgi:glutamate racemase